MKRMFDEYLNTYSTWSAVLSGINVKCPKCNGFGIVTADDNTFYFKCTSCGDIKTKSRIVYRYDVHNKCKSCERYYRVDIKEKEKQHFNALYVECPYCGFTMSGKVSKERVSFYYAGPVRNAREPFFEYELWFLTHFGDKQIWALNHEHLEYLIKYISADLREKPAIVWRRTQSTYMPAFMKKAKNRDRIVKLLTEML